MGSIRFIIFAILIWLVWRMVRNFIAEQKSKKTKVEKISSETMVKCAYCASFSPPNEAIQHNDNWFCNQQHQQLFQDKG